MPGPVAAGDRGSPTPEPQSPRGPTLLHWRVGVGQEAEVPFVVPANQRHVPLHLDAVLAPGWGGGRVGQHGRGQAGAVTLPGAEQAAAVNLCGERDTKPRPRDHGQPAHIGAKDSTALF